jgi:hypothetical protein
MFIPELAAELAEEYRRSACEDLTCDWEDYVCDSAVMQEVLLEDLGVILLVIWVRASVFRYVARRRLAETENPSACATVYCKVCKSAIALYVSVIKRECV